MFFDSLIFQLHGARADYLKNAKVSKGVKLLFSLKATSDDESTPNGRPQALARAERSQGADQVIRAVEGLMLQDLLDDGKKRAANNRQRRLVPPFGQRNPGYFQEVRPSPPFAFKSYTNACDLGTEGNADPIL
jgi:hypothetical protein